MDSVISFVVRIRFAAIILYDTAYEKHHGMIPLLINQSNIFRDFSLRLSKRLADSDLAVIGLQPTEITGARSYIFTSSGMY